MQSSLPVQPDSQPSNPQQMPGTLYGIGVGPGDPELITVKALRQLQKASVVAFPAGLRQQLGTAERTIEPWLREDQTKLPLTFPYVQSPAALETAWAQAAKDVLPYLRQGDVVFACEGDITFYSTLPIWPRAFNSSSQGQR